MHGWLLLKVIKSIRSEFFFVEMTALNAAIMSKRAEVVGDLQSD
jgi:hypothetical protein